jgi:hypothetical protein
MIGVTMLALALAIAAGAVGLFRLATRGEHLLVVGGGHGAARFFERRPDGRYAAIAASGVPGALWRFARGTPAPVVVPARGRRPAAR